MIVKDVNETVKYYEDVLGFQMLASHPEEGKFEWAMVGSGGVTLMFQTAESLSGELPLFKGKDIFGSLTLYITVDDVEELHEKIKDKAEIIKDLNKTFYGATEFVVKDPNGYILILNTQGE